MKIFLDIRGPKRGGSWTYTQSLVPELVNNRDGNDITVLYDRQQEKFNLPGINEDTIPYSSKIRWIVWSHITLPKILKNGSYDVYHSVKQLNSFKNPSKRIYTFHTAGPFVYPEFYKKIECLHWRYMFRKSAKESEAVIVCSEFDKKTFAKELRIPEEKIHVTHLAADDRFGVIDDEQRLLNAKESYNLPEKCILFVGTLYPFKNVNALITAFHKARKKGIEHSLVIAGGKGWFYDQTFSMVEDLALTDQVIFLGQVTQELPELYNLADVFVFPSLYESFGLPVLEAMACGTPVITSNRGALPEVAGEDACIIDPDDIDSFSNSIIDVLSDKDKRDRLINAGLKRAKEFSWKKCAKETLAVYEK